MKRMYVIVSGYVASGSSIICDLLEEVDGVGVLGGGKEFKLIKEPCGLLELETLLNEQWNWIRSSEAIRRFVWLYRKMGNPKENNSDYSKLINHNFLEISNQFVSDITEFRYDVGSSVIDIMDRLWSSDLKNVFLRVLHNRVSHHLFPIHKEKAYFTSISSDKFVIAARKYMDLLFDEKWGEDMYTHLCLDQALYPYDGKHMKDFFSNSKMIIVRRNPMDQLASLIEHEKGIGPEMKERPDAKKYLSWLENAQKKESIDKDIIRVSYENIICNYDEGTQKIFDFLRISPDRHTRKKEIFNPDISVKRIGKWKKYLDIPKYKQMFLAIADYYEKEGKHGCIVQ